MFPAKLASPAPAHIFELAAKAPLQLLLNFLFASLNYLLILKMPILKSSLKFLSQ
jgi:hypothetical protein